MSIPDTHTAKLSKIFYNWFEPSGRFVKCCELIETKNQTLIKSLKGFEINFETHLFNVEI